MPEGLNDAEMARLEALSAQKELSDEEMAELSSLEAKGAGSSQEKQGTISDEPMSLDELPAGGVGSLTQDGFSKPGGARGERLADPGSATSLMRKVDLEEARSGKSFLTRVNRMLLAPRAIGEQEADRTTDAGEFSLDKSAAAGIRTAGNLVGLALPMSYAIEGARSVSTNADEFMETVGKGIEKVSKKTTELTGSEAAGATVEQTAFDAIPYLAGKAAKPAPKLLADAAQATFDTLTGKRVPKGATLDGSWEPGSPSTPSSNIETKLLEVDADIRSKLDRDPKVNSTLERVTNRVILAADNQVGKVKLSDFLNDRDVQVSGITKYNSRDILTYLKNHANPRFQILGVLLEEPFKASESRPSESGKGGLSLKEAPEGSVNLSELRTIHDLSADDISAAWEEIVDSRASVDVSGGINLKGRKGKAVPTQTVGEGPQRYGLGEMATPDETPAISLNLKGKGSKKTQTTGIPEVLRKLSDDQFQAIYEIKTAQEMRTEGTEAREMAKEVLQEVTPPVRKDPVVKVGQKIDPSRLRLPGRRPVETPKPVAEKAPVADTVKPVEPKEVQEIEGMRLKRELQGEPESPFGTIVKPGEIGGHIQDSVIEQRMYEQEQRKLVQRYTDRVMQDNASIHNDKTIEQMVRTKLRAAGENLTSDRFIPEAIQEARLRESLELPPKQPEVTNVIETEDGNIVEVSTPEGTLMLPEETVAPVDQMSRLFELQDQLGLDLPEEALIKLENDPEALGRMITLLEKKSQELAGSKPLTDEAARPEVSDKAWDKMAAENPGDPTGSAVSVDPDVKYEVMQGNARAGTGNKSKAAGGRKDANRTGLAALDYTPEQINQILSPKVSPAGSKVASEIISGKLTPDKGMALLEQSNAQYAERRAVRAQIIAALPDLGVEFDTAAGTKAVQTAMQKLELRKDEFTKLVKAIKERVPGATAADIFHVVHGRDKVPKVLRDTYLSMNGLGGAWDMAKNLLQRWADNKSFAAIEQAIQSELRAAGVESEVLAKYPDILKDQDGRPRIAYHGSAATFDKLSQEKLGANTGAKSAKIAFFAVLDNPDQALSYVPTGYPASAKGAWDKKVFRGKKEAVYHPDVVRAQADQARAVEARDAYLASKGITPDDHAALNADPEAVRLWDEAVSAYGRYLAASNEYPSPTRVETSPSVRRAYINSKNPLVIDMEGKTWHEVHESGKFGNPPDALWDKRALAGQALDAGERDRYAAFGAAREAWDNLTAPGSAEAAKIRDAAIAAVQDSPSELRGIREANDAFEAAFSSWWAPQQSAWESRIAALTDEFSKVADEAAKYEFYGLGDAIEKARARGYDAVIFKNFIDYGGKLTGQSPTPVDHIAFFDAGQEILISAENLKDTVVQEGKKVATKPGLELKDVGGPGTIELRAGISPGDVDKALRTLFGGLQSAYEKMMARITNSAAASNRRNQTIHDLASKHTEAILRSEHQIAELLDNAVLSPEDRGALEQVYKALQTPAGQADAQAVRDRNMPGSSIIDAEAMLKGGVRAAVFGGLTSAAMTSGGIHPLAAGAVGAAAAYMGAGAKDFKSTLMTSRSPLVRKLGHMVHQAEAYKHLLNQINLNTINALQALPVKSQENAWRVANGQQGPAPTPAERVVASMIRTTLDQKHAQNALMRSLLHKEPVTYAQDYVPLIGKQFEGLHADIAKGSADFMAIYNPHGKHRTKKDGTWDPNLHLSPLESLSRALYAMDRETVFSPALNYAAALAGGDVGGKGLLDDPDVVVKGVLGERDAEYIRTEMAQITGRQLGTVDRGILALADTMVRPTLSAMYEKMMNIGPAEAKALGITSQERLGDFLQFWAGQFNYTAKLGANQVAAFANSVGTYLTSMIQVDTDVFVRAIADYAKVGRAWDQAGRVAGGVGMMAAGVGTAAATGSAGAGVAAGLGAYALGSLGGRAAVKLFKENRSALARKMTVVQDEILGAPDFVESMTSPTGNPILKAWEKVTRTPLIMGDMLAGETHGKSMVAWMGRLQAEKEAKAAGVPATNQQLNNRAREIEALSLIGSSKSGTPYSVASLGGAGRMLAPFITFPTKFLGASVDTVTSSIADALRSDRAGDRQGAAKRLARHFTAFAVGAGLWFVAHQANINATKILTAVPTYQYAPMLKALEAMGEASEGVSREGPGFMDNATRVVLIDRLREALSEEEISSRGTFKTESGKPSSIEATPEERTLRGLGLKSVEATEKQDQDSANYRLGRDLSKAKAQAIEAAALATIKANKTKDPADKAEASKLRKEAFQGSYEGARFFVNTENSTAIESFNRSMEAAIKAANLKTDERIYKGAPAGVKQKIDLKPK